MNYNEAYEKLKGINQLHLLKWYNELNEEEKNKLLMGIDNTDFSVLDMNGSKKASEKIEPLKTLTLDEIKEEYNEDEKLGLDLLKKGKLACILLAGGMGSRLGSENPKGMYNIGINRELSIFECQMNTLKNEVKKCGSYI